MKRRSSLPVLIRLARLEESRTLQTLGEARSATDRAKHSLTTLERQLAAARVAALLPAGHRLSAETLISGARCTVGLEHTSRTVSAELTRTRAQEEEARRALVQAKLRLRTLRSATARREKREGLERRRREVRRMDEATRGLRPEEG